MSGQTTESPPSSMAASPRLVTIKRPPPEDDDDDEDDDGSGFLSAAPPPKRVARELPSVHYEPVHTQTAVPSSQNGQNGLAHIQPRVDVALNQLRGRSADQLGDMMLDMQADFSKQVAELAAQCDALRRQMAEMEKCLSTYFSAQSAAVDAAAPFLPHRDFSRPIAPRPRPPTPPSLAQPPHIATATPRHHHTPIFSAPSRAVAAHVRPQFGPATPLSAAPPSASSAVPQRGSGASPSVHGTPAPSGHLDTIPKYQVIPRADGKPPQVVYGHVGTVAGLWREYRHGVDGQPSIESLDQTWGPSWRPEPKDRTWYSRRKLVWDKMKDFLHDDLSEEQAVAEVERIRDGRSLNWLMNLLQNNRKEAKRSWREAAATARAAKKASDESRSSSRYAYAPLSAASPPGTQPPSNGIPPSQIPSAGSALRPLAPGFSRALDGR